MGTSPVPVPAGIITSASISQTDDIQDVSARTVGEQEVLLWQRGRQGRQSVSNIVRVQSPSPPLLSFPPLPLEVGPLNPAMGLGERCKLPRRVWGQAPAANDFGAFSG